MTPSPDEQNKATAAYVESQMTTLADAVQTVCDNLDRCQPIHLRVILSAVDKGLTSQDQWEAVAGSSYLSPTYFEQATKIDEQRQQLKARLAELEDADDQPL